VKPSSERIYSFYATSFPIEPSDPSVGRTADNASNYRRIMQSSGGRRTYDPWNSVYKDIPNTTNAVTANTPFKFVYVGPIEIRGLKANTAYILSDVETGKKSTRTSNASGIIAFDTTFANSVVYHVTEAVTGSVAGMVYSGDGEILPGSTITLYSEDGEKVFWDTASDLDGFYSFPVVPAGKYYIAATFPKEFIVPQAGTAAVPNNDTRYNGFTPVNLDYFTNVYEFVSKPFTVGAGEFTFDMIVCRDVHDLKLTETIEPTCVEDGSITSTCSVCDHKDVTVLDKLGHDYVDDNCTRCGDTLITSIRINALAIETMRRNEVKQFTVIVNEGASTSGVEWKTANPALATVAEDGTVTVKNVIGTVILTATDSVTGRSHSVLLRIAS
jgi:hypothetical protein